MAAIALVDAGFVVALLSSRDAYWVGKTKRAIQNLELFAPEA